MTMKENQKGNSFDSISFGKETDSLTFGSKDRYELNDSRMDANLTGLESEDTGHCSITKVTDDSSMDNENETMGSPKKAGQNGLSQHLCIDNENGTAGSSGKASEDGLSHQLSNWEKDIDSLSSYSSDIEKEQRSPEHESFDTHEESAACNGVDSRDSSSPFCTDESVLECVLPDLEVCYKETDCQNLKDICVDEWRHEIDVNVIKSCIDGQPGCLSPQTQDIDHLEADKDSSLDSNSFTADPCGSKEENDGKTLVSQERLDTCLENSFEMDTVEQHGEPENVAETGDAYFDATGEADIGSSEESLEDRKLPIEDFVTQISLGADGGNKLMHVSDQVLCQEAVPESPAASSAQARGSGNDVQASCLLCNSKVENESMTSNISSLEGVVVGDAMAEDVKEQSSGTGDVQKNLNTENLPDAEEAKVQCTRNRVGDSHGHSLISNEDVEEQSADTGDVHKYVNAENLPDAWEANDQCTRNGEGEYSHGHSHISNEDVEKQSANSGDVHKDVNAENLPDAREGEVQCTINRVDDSRGQSLISNKMNSDGGSASSYDQCVRSTCSSCENAHEDSDDVPTDDSAETPSNSSPGPPTDWHAAARIAPNHDGWNSGDVPVVSHLQHDMGETSFSAASMITCSGPIAFSGSLSHRSDGSTTSGKSFAFPILQSEWNSSPVRMAKADRRHFRKHKGWRSGLLCCRF